MLMLRRMLMLPIAMVLALFLPALAIAGAPALAAAPATRPAVLRVAADPNNLPFSNRLSEGFENKIAELVAHDMGATV
jgi:mxaJ protein